MDVLIVFCRWKDLDANEKAKYEELAKTRKEEYKTAMEEYSTNKDDTETTTADDTEKPLAEAAEDDTPRHAATLDEDTVDEDGDDNDGNSGWKKKRVSASRAWCFA